MYIYIFFTVLITPHPLPLPRVKRAWSKKGRKWCVHQDQKYMIRVPRRDYVTFLEDTSCRFSHLVYPAW